MLSQYFYPEVGATQNRVREFAKYLAQNGHEVTVIAEFPNHPEGIIPKKYKWKLFERDSLDGFDVLRVWVWASPKKSAIRRIGFYLSYMLMSILSAPLIRGKYDVVFATSPPLFTGISGHFISRLKRARFILDIRDLWPKSAVVLGELSNTRIIGISERVELFLYRKASAVIGVTQGILEHIANLGIREDKLYFIPNGTIPEIFNPDNKDDKLRAKLGLDGKFIIAFAGNHGLAQGLDMVIECANQIRDDSEIAFLFIGDGPDKLSLIEKSNSLNLSNVIFLPKVPLENVTQYINMSDVMLVPLKRLDIFYGALPSKMFDYMCCAKPIILTVDGEARHIVENEAKSGVFSPPEDPSELAKTIIYLKNRRNLCSEYGKNGRDFVLRSYLREQQAKKLEEIMLALL